MTGAGFLPVWNAMMAAMMLPSTVPLVRLEHATTRSSPRLVALAAGAVMWAL
jgi:predicted metal-binding membrane protein